MSGTDFDVIFEVIVRLKEMSFFFSIFRYIHAVLVPILIFVVHKDLRKKAEIIICCWRPNSVEHKKSSQEMRPISAYLHQKRRDWEKKQKKFKNITNHNVPVLFASSDGLYLRLVDESGKFSCNFLISSFLKLGNLPFFGNWNLIIIHEFFKV